MKRKVSVKVRASKKKKRKDTKAVAILPKQVKEKLELPFAAGTAARKTQWDTKRTLKKNYELNKVAADSNATIGMDIDESEKKAETKVEMVPREVVDEIAATFGQERSTGKRPPKKLTTVQIKVVGKLIEKHGRENIDAMVKDIKLNKYVVGVSPPARANRQGAPSLSLFSLLFSSHHRSHRLLC